MFYKTDKVFIRSSDISAAYVSETQTMLNDGITTHYWVAALLNNGTIIQVSPYFKNNYKGAERFCEDFMADLIIGEQAEKR